MSSLKDLGLDNKFYVVKREDIMNLLNVNKPRADQFLLAIDECTCHRMNKGQKLNDYIVVNTDEPYAEQVAALVKGTGEELVEMVECEGHYYPLDFCTTTNPTTSGGKSVVDDVDLPCGYDCEVEGGCDMCPIQKVFDKYAKLTGQSI